MSAQGTSPANRPVAVATDGSESAQRAVRWAAAEAASRSRPLQVVGSFSYPVMAYSAPAPVPDSVYDALEDATRSAVSDGAALARSVAPDLEIRTETVRGPVIPALLDFAREVELLACGSRGLGGFSGLMLGSVGAALAAQAPCPVAVLRGEGDLPTTGPVVVGVDGSPHSAAAVGQAFEIASRRGCDLDAVLCWHDSVWHPLGQNDSELVLAQKAEVVLSQSLAGWREQYPDVTVNPVVVRNTPGAELRDRSVGAQLLVVGSRGRGGFAGLLLGSTSRAMIQHAECPVLVTRPPED